MFTQPVRAGLAQASTGTSPACSPSLFMQGKLEEALASLCSSDKHTSVNMLHIVPDASVLGMGRKITNILRVHPACSCRAHSSKHLHISCMFAQPVHAGSLKQAHTPLLHVHPACSCRARS